MSGQAADGNSHLKFAFQSSGSTWLPIRTTSDL
jgi:hypothetical protein